MKETKYRAWDTANKIWLDTSLFNIRLDNGLLQRNGSAGTVGGVEIVEFTGLKDKNGVEIYEGDIVQLSGYNNCQKKWLPTYKCEVKFTLEHGGYSVSTSYTDNHFNDFEAKYCEVIGNIYENPELLEAGNGS